MANDKTYHHDFYSPWPNLGKKFSNQLTEIRQDTEAISPIVRWSTVYDKDPDNCIKKSRVRGYEYGDRSKHNRFRTIYDEDQDAWVLQVNTGTEAVPFWQTIFSVDENLTVNNFYIPTQVTFKDGTNINVSDELNFNSSDFYLSTDLNGDPVVNLKDIAAGAGISGIDFDDTINLFQTKTTLNFNPNDFYLTPDSSGDPVVNSKATAGGGGGISSVTFTDGVNSIDSDELHFNDSKFYLSTNLDGKPVVNFIPEARCDTPFFTEETEFVDETEVKVVHNFNQEYVSADIYDDGFEQIYPDEIDTSNPNITYFYLAESTSGWAFVSSFPCDARKVQEFSSQKEWVFNHGFGSTVGVDVYDTKRRRIIPDEIDVSDPNRTYFYFVEDTAGLAIISSLQGTRRYDVGTAQKEWQIGHNFCTVPVLAEVYDDSFRRVVPDKVDVSDPNKAYFYFSEDVSGSVLIQAGQQLGNVVKKRGQSDQSVEGNVIFNDAVSVGFPGNEKASIRVNNSNFFARTKLNDFGGALDAQLVMHRHSPSFSPTITFARAKSSDITHDPVESGDTLMSITSVGHSGTAAGYRWGAEISTVVDGEPDGTDMPTRMLLRTTKKGATAPTTAVIIDKSQNVTFASDMEARGSFYLDGKLDVGTGAIIREDFNVGPVGFEEGTIRLNNNDFHAGAKINRFGGTIDAMFHLHRHSASFGANLLLSRTHSNTISHSVVQDNDILGSIYWAGHTGDTSIGYQLGAQIDAVVDGTPSTTSMPTELLIKTTPTGSISPATKIWIKPNGQVGIGADPSTTYPILVASGTDGPFRFEQSGFTNEGIIELRSVTGQGAYYRTEDGATDRWRWGHNTGNNFVIEDENGSTTPLTIEAGADTNSIYVDADGHVGLGGDPGAFNLYLIDSGQVTCRIRNSSNNGVFWQIASGATTEQNAALDLLDQSSGGSGSLWRIGKDGVGDFVISDGGTTSVVKVEDGSSASTIYVDSSGVSFNGIGSGVAPPDYTVTNPTTDRAFDASAATLGELRNVVGTIIEDLIAVGLFQ